jgi:cytochrome P450
MHANRGATIIGNMTGPTTTLRQLPGPRRTENLRRIRQLFNDVAPALDGLRAVYGPICGLGFPGARIVVIGDPALMQQMFAMKPDAFRWRHKFNVIGVRFIVGSQSMIVSDGADHQHRRGSVQRGFTRPRLNGWIPMIAERTDAAVDQILKRVGTDGGPIDLYPVGRELILGITLHAFFGEHLAQRVDEFSELFQRAQAFIEAPAAKQIPHPFPFTARSRVRADRKRIDRIINAEIAQRRTRPTRDPLDLLEAVVADATLSDAEIRDQVDTLIGAGYDTTAATLAWLVWRAALEPGVWTKIRGEADQILGPPEALSRRIDDTSFARLDYTRRVVHESLRLHPAGLIGARVAAADIELGGCRIPRGALIVWSPYLAGRDAHTWPDPLHFDPDRHTNLSPEQKAINDRAWIPFGRGPHMCIGFVLAEIELTVIIACLAQRLDVTLTASTVPKPVGMVVNRPVGGALFHVRARSPSERLRSRTDGGFEKAT